jgi:hypothetical protein
MTADEVYAFRDSLQATLDGYVQPRAYGVGVETTHGWRFPVTNTDGQHRLPAVVLASVIGYRHDTQALAMSPQQLASAIELLAPVEACTAFDHPNLWSWRDLISDHPGGPFTAVFVGDEDADGAQHAATVAFRAAAGL